MKLLKTLWKAWRKHRLERELAQVKAHRIYLIAETNGLQRYLDEREQKALRRLANFQ